MPDLAADHAFARHTEDVGEQLADATWPPPRYDYAVVQLPAAPAAARAARAWARAAPVASSLTERERDDVVLVICELVTNAVRHVGSAPGEESVSLALGVAAPRLRVEVCDTGPGFSIAAIDPPQADAPDGRGLFIVDALAVRWGASRRGRHCVWAELER